MYVQMVWTISLNQASTNKPIEKCFPGYSGVDSGRSQCAPDLLFLLPFQNL